jgi:hypothetical protein
VGQFTDHRDRFYFVDFWRIRSSGFYDSGASMSHQTQSINRARDQAQRQERDMSGFDYGAPAELYPSRIKKGRGRVTYKRFDTAAEALRFAIEEIPPAVLLGAYLEVDEARFGVAEMRNLYDAEAYPLKRAAVQN